MRHSRAAGEIRTARAKPGADERLTGRAIAQGGQFVAAAVAVLMLGAVVAPAPASGQSCGPWETARPLTIGQNLADITYGNGTYVAVGSAGNVQTSPDGTTWTRRDLPLGLNLRSATWDGAQFLAVGYRGTVATSPDGVSWLVHASVGEETLMKVIWTGALYVAVGQTEALSPPYHSVVLRSADGLRWSRVVIDGVDLWSVAWNGSRFVAVGEFVYPQSGGVVWTSEDAAVWTLQANVGYQFFAVIWAADRFVVTGSYRFVGSSADGVQWSWTMPSLLANGFGVAWDGTRYVVVGNNSSNGRTVIATSTDLATWSSVAPVAYYTLEGVAWVGGKFVAVGSLGVIMASDDGFVWGYVLPGVGTGASGIARGSDRFVAVGGSFTATSPDGVVWTPHPVDGSPELTGVAWNGERFVAVGFYGILASLDGVTWTPQTLPDPSALLLAVAWNGSEFLAVGNTELTSPDGLTWTAPSTTGFDYWQYGVAWTGSQWVTVGWNGEVETSPDGLTWDKHTIAGEYQLNGVASNGSLLIAVGGNGLYTATDPSTWVKAQTPDHWSLNAVAFSGDGAFAVGDVGVILDSPDGVTWNEGLKWFGSNYYAAAATATRRVAGGESFAWRDCGPTADLEVAVAVDNGVPRPADAVTVTVTLTNRGPLAASGLTVAAPVPPGMLYTSDDGQGSYVPTNGVWSPGGLAPAASATLHITATATTLGVAPFTAELLTSDQPDPDSTPGNHDPAEDDQATVNLIVACGNPDAPALSVPSGASSGETYTVSWSATSPDGTYELEEATDSAFASPTTFSETGTSRSVSHTPAMGTIYYYRARATVSCGGVPHLSGWSNIGQIAVSFPLWFAPAALAVDAAAGTGTSGNLNGVLEPGEAALVAPSWTNTGTTTHYPKGAALLLTGPAGAEYTIPDAAAGYGTVAPGATANCYDATGNCYVVQVSAPAVRPVLHWDTTLSEKLSTGEVKIWTLHVGNSFADVPPTRWAYSYIETMLHKNITAGCGNGNYCPGIGTSRWQMAVFLSIALAGNNVPTSGTVPGMGDYNCVSGGQSVFGDVAPTDSGCKFIHYIAANGITAGCGGGNYCPSATLNRDQMAVFITKGFNLNLYGP